jgi:DNA-directed RNA polymerase subunit RPC12/RpoP
MSPTAVYRCFYCQHDLHRILDHGKERLLWCSRCACRRRFVRQDERLVAEAWPPREREERA